MFHRLTALRPIGYRDELRRFRPGLDYTVAHHGAMTVTARLDATICFVDDDRIALLGEDDNGVDKTEIKDKQEKISIEQNKKGSVVYLSFTTTHFFILLKMRQRGTQD